MESAPLLGRSPLAWKIVPSRDPDRSRRSVTPSARVSCRVECREAAGRYERAAEHAAELVRLKVDVLVTDGLPAARAAKQATTTIPVVMGAVGDPVRGAS
jgi:hypothetical protein